MDREEFEDLLEEMMDGCERHSCTEATIVTAEGAVRQRITLESV
jgi:hypothetical protein